MKEMFMSEVGKCFKEGHSKCVGRGKMAVVISVGFTEKGTFENTSKDLNHPRGMSGGCSFQTGRIFSANVFALEECACVHSLHF